MKLKNLLNLMVLGLTLTITAVGCKTKPYHPTTILGHRQEVGDPNGVGSGKPLDNGTGITSTPNGIPPNTIDRSTWTPDAIALKPQTIYFEFDKASVKSSEQSKLEEVANYLKGHPEAVVKVEGNCDERGTEEYNRSLGERRALAAREYLVHLGIDPSHVDTISYGEDKPAEQGHSEAAWSKNRRDDFVVLTPPKVQ